MLLVSSIQHSMILFYDHKPLIAILIGMPDMCCKFSFAVGTSTCVQSCVATWAIAISLKYIHTTRRYSEYVSCVPWLVCVTVRSDSVEFSLQRSGRQTDLCVCMCVCQWPTISSCPASWYADLFVCMWRVRLGRSNLCGIVGLTCLPVCVCVSECTSADRVFSDLAWRWTPYLLCMLYSSHNSTSQVVTCNAAYLTKYQIDPIKLNWFIIILIPIMRNRRFIRGKEAKDPWTGLWWETFASWVRSTGCGVVVRGGNTSKKSWALWKGLKLHILAD